MANEVLGEGSGLLRFLEAVCVAEAASVKLNKLAHGMAFLYATMMIGSHRVIVAELEFADVYDLDSPDDADDLKEEIADAIEYLDLRGLLERNFENKRWVQILDESEATA